MILLLAATEDFPEMAGRHYIFRQSVQPQIARARLERCRGNFINAASSETGRSGSCTVFSTQTCAVGPVRELVLH